jgi:gliding motility-associated-like protein
MTAAPAKAVKEPSKLPNSIPPSTFDRYTPIITASPSSGYAPLNVKLSFYGDAKDATWNTGDGTEAITSSVTDHTYNQPGTYVVELITTDPDGVRHTAKAQIEVKAPSVVNTIPNVFTPNADGMNDRFEVTGEKIQKLEAAIFDKSGRQVYRWTGTDGGWDGRLLSGETAPEGTYFYVIFARGADERSYQFKGTVTLIR